MLTWRGKSLQDLTETQLRAALTEAVSEMLGPKPDVQPRMWLPGLFLGMIFGAFLAALGFVVGMRLI